MPAVGGGVVAGQGQGHQDAPVLLHEPPCLQGREVVRPQPVAVHGEMLEGQPWDAGDGVGVGRRGRLRLGQEAVGIAEAPPVVLIVPVESIEAVLPGRPCHGYGVVVLVQDGIQGREGVVEAHHAVPLRDFEFLLTVQAPCRQPQVRREELQPRRLQCQAKIRHIHPDGDGIPRGGHAGEVVELLHPGPGFHVNGRKLHCESSPFAKKHTMLPRGEIRNAP